jgi:hypothetical protein
MNLLKSPRRIATSQAARLSGVGSFPVSAKRPIDVVAVATSPVKRPPIDIASPSAASPKSPHRRGQAVRATSVATITGDSYDGVHINDVVVLFKRDLTASFTGVTFIEPLDVVKHFITGLVPGVQYTVVKTERDGAIRITVIKGTLADESWFIADAEGVLAF